MVAGIMIAVIGIWYAVLYRPVIARTATIREDMKANEDSITAIVRYKEMESALKNRIKQLYEEIDAWDSRFPPRSSLINIAKQIMSFCQANGIKLEEMQPSLFELYALERAGNTVAGKYIFKQLFTLRLRGQYRNFGRMLERMQSLPFKITVSDIKMSVIEGSRPDLNIDLEMFIYVHR